MTSSDPGVQPVSLTCPVCGNVNRYDDGSCLKCQLPLAPIRDALELARNGAAARPEADPPTDAGALKDRVQGRRRTPPAVGAKPDTPGSAEPGEEPEPAPPLPELPTRGEDEPTAMYGENSRFLIRGMGDRATEIAARFFQRIADRGIEGLKLSLGKLIIKIDEQRSDSRDYYFAERVFEDEARATMAVRIAPSGTDLFVEWRHYTTAGLVPEDNSGVRLGCGGIGAVVVFIAFLGASGAREVGGWHVFGGLGVVAILFSVLIGAKNWKVYKAGLEGFQTQDSTAFQLSVRAALEEAIDLAGISKELIQQLRDDDDKERRVI